MAPEQPTVGDPLRRTRGGTCARNDVPCVAQASTPSPVGTEDFIRSVWVPRMPPGQAEQCFRGTAWDDETRSWPCRFSMLALVRILQLLRLSRSDSGELAIEVVMLRHEGAVLLRQVVRPALRPHDRALLAGLGRLLDRRCRGRFFVEPETLLRWQRDLVRLGWTQPHRPGRPSILAGKVAIILRSARENPTWG